MPGTLKNVLLDKDAFEVIMRKLIASPPIRKDDLKPKRKRKRVKEVVQGLAACAVPAAAQIPSRMAASRRKKLA